MEEIKDRAHQWTCFDVRYSGAKADIDELRSMYGIDAYVDLVERKNEALGQTTFHRVEAQGRFVLRDFCPRIYQIAERVLQRLGLQSEVVYVYLVNDPVFKAAVFLPTKERHGFTFAISSSLFARLSDDEVAFWFGEYLAYELFDVNKYAALVPQKTDEESETYVLPPMGNALFRGWLRKEWISADRIAAIAAGGFEPCALALLREQLGIDARDILIPSGKFLEEAEEHFVVPDADSTDDQFLPFRLRAMRLFCDQWFAPTRGTFDTTALDAEVDAMFAQMRRYPKDELSQAMMLLLADWGYDLLVKNGRGSDRQIGKLIDLLWRFTDSPTDLFKLPPKDWRNRRESVLRFFADHWHEGAENSFVDVMRALVDVALMTENNVLPQVYKYASRLAQFSGSEGRERFMEIVKGVREDRDMDFKDDPLMDELVTRVKLRWDGRSEKTIGSLRKKLSVPVVNSSLDRFRYSGDVEVERILRDVYHVEAFLDYCRNSSAASEYSERYGLLRNSVWLTPSVSPRVAAIIDKVKLKLEYAEPLFVFCMYDSSLNAEAWREETSNGPVGYVRITSSALEALDDDELTYLIGHEMGHLIFKNDEWGNLKQDTGENGKYKTRLPLMGDQLYRKWSQMKEITADRMGLIASENLEASLKAQIKVSYGLSGKNIAIDAIDSLLHQIEEIKDDEIVEGDDKLSHPIDHIRLKALQLFGKAYLNGERESFRKVDDEISTYLSWIRHYPRTKIEQAAMQVFATGSVTIVESDGKLDEREIREILDTLVRCYTEDPLAELVVDHFQREKRFREAAGVLYHADDDEVREHVMQLLIRVAMADGVIGQKEQRRLGGIAEKIGYDNYDFQVLEERVVQKIGFPIDFLLEDAVRDVRAQSNASK